MASYRIRPATPEDAPQLAALLSGMSPTSREMRYFVTRPLSEAEIEREIQRLTSGHADRGSLVALAEVGEGEAVIGVAEYVREACCADSAEIGVLVQDEYQRQGVGTAMMRQLAHVATDHGITTATAYIQAENEAIRRLLRRLNVPIKMETRRGVTTLRAPLTSASPPRP